MITIRKLLSLKDSTRYRKIVNILLDMESNLKENKSINLIYLKDLYDLIKKEFNSNKRVIELTSSDITLRNLNSLRHTIMTYLSIEPSEWDFYNPRDKEGDRKTLPISLYLDDLRSPFNIGSIFRTGECFGVNKILVSKDTTPPNHKRALRTSMGCIDSIDWEVKEPESIEGPIFALELGGTPIDEFVFPESGTVFIGSEELGISPENLKLCDSSYGRVTIPLLGNKSSLNVSSATAILLQRWNEALK